MSLINQMLKDLDARRAEAGGASPFGEQVRAVPARRNLHPAWWLAMALALALSGVLAWIALGPAPAEPQAGGAPLPLQFALEIGPTDAPEFAVHAAEKTAADPVPSMESGRMPAGSEPATAVETPKITPVSVAEARLPQPATLPPAPEKAVPAPVVEPVAEVATAVREPAPPLVKQMREPTSQQLAENAYREALRALQQGRRSEALRGFEQALRLDGGHASARQTLIAVLLEDGESAEALRVVREGVELDARQVGWAMILARLQLEKNDLPGAIETLERARPHAASQVDFIAFHAALLQRASRHREAIEQYTHALQRMPQNDLWWMGLGISLQAEQRNDEAREAFQRAKAGKTLSPELAAFVDQRLAQLR